ncbi:MAG: xanthine dehydrogenase family protein [Caulobacteraceae bacterium]|nr:xanthine dehydrogenase family protein [Caulobacteraceae bacterium]
MTATTAAPGMAARFVGRRVPRKEDRRLLTGRGSYVDDVVLPGMLEVAFHRSQVARGAIRGIDLEAARAVPGVRAIFTVEDLEAAKLEMHYLFGSPEAHMPKTPLLAKGRVAFVGDPIVMVVADNRYIAEDAAGLITVDYDMETPVVTMEQAAASPPIHPDLESNLGSLIGMPDDPSIPEIFAKAAHVVEGTVRHQRQAMSPMEPRGVVASRQGSGEVVIYLSCQSPHMAARFFQDACALPDVKFRVIAKDVGGAFGLKVQPWREEAATVAAALLLRRPVKWIEDRLENLTSACQAREWDIEVRLAFDADARLLAADVDYQTNVGAWPVMVDSGGMTMMMFPGPYRLPKLAFRGRGWYSNTAGLAAYRGPWLSETVGREAIMDKAARQIGICPVELRRRNMVTREEQPHMHPTGVAIRHVTPGETLDQVLAKIDLPAFRAEQAAARAEGRYLGLGLAVYIEPTTMSAGGILASDAAHIRIEPNGRVTAVLSTHSQGHGTETTMAQVIADELGVPFEQVDIYEDDSSRGSFGPGAGGSRQAVSGGGAAIRASRILSTKVKRIAGHLLNANPDDIRIEDGMIHVAGVAEVSTPLQRIAETAYFEPDRLPPDADLGLAAEYRYRAPPPFVFSNAAHACVCEVDVETGVVKILRWVASEDCGVIINPSVVEGQIAGGVAQGIGGVLLEHISYDEQGNPKAATFKDYLLPTVADVPEIEFCHFVSPSDSEGGFKGVGEGGAIISPPTLINAVADALSPFGIDCLQLPLTPARLTRWIDEARQGAG